MTKKATLPFHEDIKPYGIRFLTQQLFQIAPAYFRFSEGFNFAYLQLAPINADVLCCKNVNETLELVTTGGQVALLFHTHAWCGAIQIEVNGTVQNHSLYAEKHGFKTIALVSADDTPLHIIIRTGAPADPLAKGHEVWLAAVDFDQPQDWRQPRSQPITPYCSLTRGEYGSFLTLASDITIGADIVRTGVWAPKDVELFKSLIQPGMTVLDIGANIGHHTVVYSSLVGHKGRVIAFEPQTVIYQILAANVAINGCLNTHIIQSCVGDSEGFAYLYPVSYNNPTNFGALGIDTAAAERGDKKGERCRIATLDQLLSELAEPLTRCDFIKIDVQSYELFVLNGGQEILAKFRPVLFLEISPFWMLKNYDYREIYRFLWNAGYTIEHPSDPTVKPGEIKEWSGQESEEWDILARPK